MRTRWLMVAAAAGALALPAAASGAPSAMKVTGGGQLTEPGQTSGPGRTITFNAQGDPSSAKGHLQYNDHAGTKLHGRSTCVITGFDEERMLNIFEIVGVLRDGTTYNIKGSDGGQGGDSPNDMILFDSDSDDTTCDLEERDMYDEGDELGRGNVKIHKTKNRPSRRSGATRVGSDLTNAFARALL